jgi:hypothetical protein
MMQKHKAALLFAGSGTCLITGALIGLGALLESDANGPAAVCAVTSYFPLSIGAFGWWLDSRERKAKGSDDTNAA